MHNKGFWLMSLMAVVCSLPAAAQISNGTNLTVPVDGYGSWYTNFQTGGSFGESFQPCGFSAGYPTFSAGTFIFVEGVHRGILTDYAPWIGIFASNPPTLTVSLTSGPNFADIAYGDSVNDTAHSTVSITGTDFSLSLELTQAARRTSDSCKAFLVQRYRFTNTGSSAVSFRVNRAWDLDMYWRLGVPNDYTNDEVGVGSYGGQLYPWQGEFNAPATRCSLSSIGPQTYYYAAKRLHTPSGGPPTMGYGTDVITWNNYGTPTTWQNYGAFIGYNTTGACGDQLDDAHISLEWHVSLAPNASTEIIIVHTYGSDTPAICSLADVNTDGVVDDADLLAVLFDFGGTQSDQNTDVNFDGVVDDADLLTVLFEFGSSCSS